MGHILDRGVTRVEVVRWKWRERERDMQGVGVRGSCQQGSRCLEPASVVGSRDELDSQGPQRFLRFVNLPAQVVQ